MKPDLLTNERMFLGCLLRSPHELFQVMDMVKPDMLADGPYRGIYSAMVDLAERSRQVTRPALLANLPAEYDDYGPTVGILIALQENAAEAGSATDYAPFICEAASRKKLQALSKWLAKESGKLEAGAEDIAAEAALRLQAIMQDASPLRPALIGESASKILASYAKGSDGGFNPGLNTGIGPLDEILGLMLGGDLGFIMQDRLRLMAQRHRPQQHLRDDDAADRGADRAGQIIDPHTAIGLAAARTSGLASDIPVVTLATAHPAKFGDAVERATGVRPSLPARVGNLFDREERYDRLPATKDAVAAYVAERATPAA